MNTAECNNFGFSFLGFVSETERITDVVSDILNRADLIIVDENDSVFFLFARYSSLASPEL